MPPFLTGLVEGALWDDVREFAQTEIVEAVKRWYVELPQDWFDNPNPFPDGTSRRNHPRRWMYQLTQGGEGATAGWHAESDGETLSVCFMNPDAEQVAYGLRLHQYGGVIEPKNVAALTIPITAEAQGVKAANFPHELFVVSREDAQDDPDKIGTLVWEDENGMLHGAYVLRKRSEVPALKERRGHDALPSEGELAGYGDKAFSRGLETVIKLNSL